MASSAGRAFSIGRNLAVAAVTAEVVSSMRGEGVRSLLLRGPAIARWLYAREVERIRTYEDLDLLIAPDDVERCQRALE